MNKKALVEALIFASKGISLKKLVRVLKIDEQEILKIIGDIEKEYSREEHGIELREVEGRYRFYTKKELGEYVEKLLKKSFSRLTANQLEVVVIIAMNGPLTKSEIDEMRGKDSSNIVRTLYRMGVVRRRRAGRRIRYDLSKSFKESAVYEEISRILRGGDNG